MARPPDHDKIAMAKALLDWSMKDDSINLNAFCVSLKPPIPPQYITRWAKECDVFCEAYNIAKANLGARRERKLNTQELHVKAYDLNAAVYDYFLKQERRDEQEFLLKVKAEMVTAGQTPPNDSDLKALINALKNVSNDSKPETD